LKTLVLLPQFPHLGIASVGTTTSRHLPAKPLYVVVNSGHTFHEKELSTLNYLLLPRLGDWAVVRVPGEPSEPSGEDVIQGGFFDEQWAPPRNTGVREASSNRTPGERHRRAGLGPGPGPGRRGRPRRDRPGATLDRAPALETKRYHHLHSAGQSPGGRRRAHELFREDLRRFAAGEMLLNVVDKKAGY
jgi:hypothetical protein